MATITITPLELELLKNDVTLLLDVENDQVFACPGSNGFQADLTVLDFFASPKNISVCVDDTLPVIDFNQVDGTGSTVDGSTDPDTDSKTGGPNT